MSLVSSPDARVTPATPPILGRSMLVKYSKVKISEEFYQVIKKSVINMKFPH